MLTIKPATLTEAYQIHLQIPEFEDQVPLSRFEEQLATSDQQQILIAYFNDQPAGYMVSYDRYKDGSIYCWMTGVLPAFRRHGILKNMMNELIRWAKAEGFKEMKIKTRNSRREMLGFLVKNGFDFLEIDQRKMLKDHRILLSKNL